MKGWTSRETVDVTVVVDNHKDARDVATTAIHEIVAHRGFRLLFGTREKLDNALDEMYSASGKPIKDRIDRIAEKLTGARVSSLMEEKRKAHEEAEEDPDESYYADLAASEVQAYEEREQIRRDATEEYATELSEKIGAEGFAKMDAEELTFWGKIKGMLQKALDRLLAGLKLPKMRKLTDKEWSYVLWRSWKNLREEPVSPGDKPAAHRGFFAEAEDIVMRERMLFNADPLMEKPPQA